MDERCRELTSKIDYFVTYGIITHMDERKEENLSELGLSERNPRISPSCNWMRTDKEMDGLVIELDENG